MTIDINNGLGPLAQGGSKTTERQESQIASKTPEAREHTSKDTVKISDDATNLREMQARLERQESFDEARVSEIRQAISEGRYPIDNERLAEKFLELESQL
jgi:negative regulator of flagellin synthesis FlgM